MILLQPQISEGIPNYPVPGIRDESVPVLIFHAWFVILKH